MRLPYWLGSRRRPPRPQNIRGARNTAQPSAAGAAIAAFPPTVNAWQQSAASAVFACATSSTKAGGSVDNAAASLILHRLIQPLVIEAAAHRQQRVAEFAGVLGNFVPLERGRAAPDLDQRQLIGPAVLLPFVE